MSILHYLNTIELFFPYILNKFLVIKLSREEKPDDGKYQICFFLFCFRVAFDESVGVLFSKEMQNSKVI